MTVSVKLDEVTLIYKVKDGIHFFLGNDEWTRGIVAANQDYETAREEALEQLRGHLRVHHNVRQGEWEFVTE